MRANENARTATTSCAVLILRARSNSCELRAMASTDEYNRKVTDALTVFVPAAIKAVSNFNNRQNSLELAGIFQPDKLFSSSFRQEALEKLGQLELLLAEYKNFYSQYSVEFTRNLLLASSELPPEERRGEAARLVLKMQQEINEQSDFYSVRESWIVAVRSFVSLFEDHGPKIEFDGEQLLFHDDDLFERFSNLTSTIDHFAAIENAMVQRRVATLMSAGEQLGLFKQ